MLTGVKRRKANTSSEKENNLETAMKKLKKTFLNLSQAYLLNSFVQSLIKYVIKFALILQNITLF